jgi:hypothetical protein
MQHRWRYFPAVFRWRGRRYQVDAVDCSWLVPAQGWRRRHDRRFFQARCAKGILSLYQDLKTGTWHLRRASACCRRRWGCCSSGRRNSDRLPEGGETGERIRRE